jgi:hypothetical protein
MKVACTVRRGEVGKVPKGNSPAPYPTTDWLFGPKAATEEETYVLCEINVSSVYPFPESALPKLVHNVVTRLKHQLS